jgi:hypothetical protein
MMSKIPQIHERTEFPTKCASCGGNVPGEWDADSKELRGACCGHVYYGERHE